MSFLQSTEYSLYLGGGKVRLRRVVNWPWLRKWEDCGAFDHGDWASMAEHLVGPSPRLTVWLGGAHCRWITFDRPKGVYTDDQLTAIASRLFSAKLGIEPNKWRTAVSPLQAGVVAAAVQLSLLEEIQTHCQPYAHVGAVRPWFERVAGTQKLLGRKVKGISLIEDESLIFMDCRADFLRLSTVAIGEESGANIAHRFALQSGLAGQVTVLRYRAEGGLPTHKARADFLDCLVVEESPA